MYSQPKAWLLLTWVLYLLLRKHSSTISLNYCLSWTPPPLSLNYHFWVTPRPYPSLSVFITYCIVFQHILMRFISFLKFCFTKISNICSDITHHTPCPHIIWLSLSEPNPPIYRWMIYLNAPLSFKWLVCLSQ